MAADTKVSNLLNGITKAGKPLELAITLPQSPGTKILLHLTIHNASVMLFLANDSIDASGNGAAMGSFIYAMPDKYNPTQPLSTALYTVPSSQDFATRMAKLLARKTQKPCYVGSSINLTGLAGGEAVEEEMAVFRIVAETVLSEVHKFSHADS